ncbi:MAG: O-antigen ligase family protein, partial [Saprospiraceae bacterium]
MKILLESYKAQVILLSMVWMVSMVFSHEFVLSQAMILLVALALFERRPGFPWLRLRRGLGENTAAWWRYRPNLMIAIPFLLVLVSGLWSSDFSYTLERLRIKLPFLVLPWAFAGIPRFSRKEYRLILYFLIGMMALACLYVGFNYLLNFDQINQLIGMGKTIPTPSNHIRFSLVLCFAILSGIFLLREGAVLRYSWERRILLVVTVFLFLFIHMLSVRSGLLALYAALFVWLLRYVVLTRRWAVAAVAGGLLILLPAGAYQVFPSLRAKIAYSRWDILQHRQGTGANYSDSDRLTSLEVGWKVVKEAPVFGVGAGDLKREVTEE